MSNLGSMLTLEYGEALPAEARSGDGFPVFGSNGEVGRHRKFLIPEPGIIVGRKGSVGKVTWSDEPFWPIDTTYWVRCASEDRHWIYWVLTWLPLARLDSSTGVPGLNRNDVYALTVERPGRSAREKIAEILDTLETAIHETEAIIAKLKAVKQGLLHDLLTRGIDANGELRPPQSEAPHLYKPSPLGWIPKEWDAVPLRKLVLDTYRYPSYYGISYVETGVPEVRGECVQPDGTLSHANSGYRYVSEKTASRYPRVRLNPGDLVMTVRGTIGKFALVPEWLKGAVITANLLKLSPDQNVVAPSWLMHVLLSSAFQDRLDAACSATTIKTIQVPALLDIGIATPLKTEQQEIGARLSAIDERLSVELINLEKLNLNKRGLMNDLLTGRVRVTPLLQEAQQA